MLILPNWLKEHPVYKAYLDGTGCANKESALQKIQGELTSQLQDVIALRAIEAYLTVSVRSTISEEDAVTWGD